MRIFFFLFFALTLHTGYAQNSKVLILYDMEGISGVESHDQITMGKKGYETGRRLLTRDVNAAIRGLKAGGATTIVVADAHGSGNKEADILLEEMDTTARFDFRSLSNEPYIDCIDSTFDAVVCIGMHARAFTKGFIAHTYTDDISFNVNGHELTETDIIALSAARFGIPVIMVSGDDVLQQQLASYYPHLQYATVKYSKSFSLCTVLPETEAHQKIYESARLAMQQYQTAAAYRTTAPFVFTLSFRTPKQLKKAQALEGTKRKDNRSLEFVADDFASGFKRALKVLPLF